MARWYLGRAADARLAFEGADHVDAQLKKESLNLLYVGLGLQLVGWVVAATFPIESIRRGAPLLMSAGGVAIVLGAIRIAKAKGYAWFYGLIGVCGVLGYGLVWFVLKDKHESSPSG
jgi:predicted acyltransferase